MMSVTNKSLYNLKGKQKTFKCVLLEGGREVGREIGGGQRGME